MTNNQQEKPFNLKELIESNEFKKEVESYKLIESAEIKDTEDFRQYQSIEF